MLFILSGVAAIVFVRSHMIRLRVLQLLLGMPLFCLMIDQRWQDFTDTHPSNY